MFPTFVSIIDIQSWWEVPSIAHFCSLFRTAFNLLDFDIEDLEEALLTDGTEEASWLQELIVKLLSGCLPNNEISTFNYQMFLRRLFRQKCQEHDRYNPFNTDTDFQILPLRTKVDILHALCDFRLDAEDVLDLLKNLEADSLRVEPLGHDNNDSAYWYFYGTRLYREDFKNKNKKANSVWQVICFTEEDWFQLAKKFKKSATKVEKQLYRTLTENFLPELPRLFLEKEKLARKRLLEKPRKSSRIQKLETLAVEERLKADDSEKEKKEKETADAAKRKELENRRREAYERRAKRRELTEGNRSEKSESRYEMVATKVRNKKASRQRDSSRSSTSSQDYGTDSGKTSGVSAVGRQTNNSLASATGQIVIQPVSNPHRKKLKTSQVFRQTDEDLQTGMHKILDHIKDHDDAWPFIDPVEEEYAPNYYSIIRKPMDLQKMEERLDAGYYKSFVRFRSDFQLIVDNCRLYNGVENEYTEMVDNLSKAFERATKRFLDQISSSDDEIAVEFPETDSDVKQANVRKRKSEQPPPAAPPPSASSKRKPTLAAQTDKKEETTVSEDDSRSDAEIRPPNKKSDKKHVKTETKVVSKNNKHASGKQKKKHVKEAPQKKRRSASPVEDRWSSSPPPSWPPSSPESCTNFPTSEREREFSYSSGNDTSDKNKGKQKLWKSTVESQHNKKATTDRLLFNMQQKDKHNKLRETIEKLKAKSELNKIMKIDPKRNRKPDEKKPKTSDDESTRSTPSENKNKSKIDALSLATEQTLKDINKWLDDTPGFSEFSSASNSPSPCFPADEFDPLPKKADKSVTVPKREASKEGNNQAKRRPPPKEPTNKFLKRREIHRTIDRLQPGKSKGNLLSNMQTTKAEELFPLGPLSKIKDTKNSLIVKTDDSAPKLSLGTVLDSFGKHKFVDDPKKEQEEEIGDVKDEKGVDESVSGSGPKDNKGVGVSESEDKTKEKKDSSWTPKKENSPGKATPNLSAWFKAFGAPKVQQSQKKSETTKPDATAENTTTEDTKLEPKKDETSTTTTKITSPPEPSPNPESPVSHGQPAPRQRKISTGSSMSERSSFSQDMDSPRVGIDERSGAYPAPYPSPLHRSPSGVSPAMASPRPDMSPKAPTYNFNGQIRVGFYQDTVSTKSSPDKSCSPRDNPQSLSFSPQYPASEHVYLPHSTSSQPYSYGNPYGYCQNSYTNPSSPISPMYSSETQSNAGFYDTNKSLTDQYQAKQTLVPDNGASAGQESKMMEKQHMQSAAFPMKKRLYNEVEQYANRHEVQDLRSNSEMMMEHKEPPKQQQPYVHQNIPDPKAMQQQPVPDIYMNQPNPQQQHQEKVPNGMMPFAASAGTENVAQQQQLDRKVDMSKYTNMGYTGADVSYGRSPPPQYNYGARGVQVSEAGPDGNNSQLNMALRYGNTSMYKDVSGSQQIPHSTTLAGIHHQSARYTSSMMDMDIRSNLGHMVDRFSGADERLLSGVASAFYGDKGNGGHMFNKPIVTSASGLPMSMQYGGSGTVSAYSRQLQQQQQQQQQSQQQSLSAGESIGVDHQQQQQQQQEKKSAKRRKNSKAATGIQEPAHQSTGSNVPNQGFQSYAGLKNTMEPNAISLKTTSVVPGSAFNFGPTPAGLGLYGDKDAYPNFLDDFRTTPNYYMAAAAAAHHRTAPEMPEKTARNAHQASTPQGAPPGYPFLGAPQPRPPGYPPPFMAPHQAQLIDPSSPLYQQYVLHQGLLGPAGPYPAGYHPALGIRQSYDAMPRPSWL